MREIAPWFGLTKIADADKTVAVLGCPFGSSDAFRGGAEEGPRAIREWTRTAEAVSEVGHPIDDLRVIDCGDVELEDDDPEERWRAIEMRAGEVLGAYPGAFLLGLGGDHAVTPPLAAAARRARGDLAFLLVDAHPDCFDVYDDDPLSHACVIPRLWDRAGFRRSSTCIVGVRSYALDELEIMDTAGLVVPARPWQAFDPGALAAEIRASTRGKPLYISLDIDVLDPSCAPGTGYPVAGGPDARELLTLLREIFAGQAVAALDLVEVAPAVDPSGITAATAAHLLLQLFGYLSLVG